MWWKQQLVCDSSPTCWSQTVNRSSLTRLRSVFLLISFEFFFFFSLKPKIDRSCVTEQLMFQCLIDLICMSSCGRCWSACSDGHMINQYLNHGQQTGVKLPLMDHLFCSCCTDSPGEQVRTLFQKYSVFPQKKKNNMPNLSDEFFTEQLHKPVRIIF